MRQMAILVALLFLLACPLTLASDAARMTLPSGMNSPLTIRYPELAQAPAPALIGEGLRATYEMVVGSPEVAVSRGDVAYTKGDYGAGLVQIDVVALEDGQAATWTVSYAPDSVLGGLKKVNFYGSVNPAGCGDFCCNPAVLASIPDKAGDDLNVDRGEYDLDGREYDVIRFYSRSQGITLGMIYDLDTGILLHHQEESGRVDDLSQRPSLPADAAGDPVQRLKTLKNLLDEGLISQEEYDSNKEKILAELVSPQS